MTLGLVAAAQLVHYIYTDKLMDLPEHKDNHKPERLEMIHQLRSLATKFCLKHLLDVVDVIMVYRSHSRKVSS